MADRLKLKLKRMQTKYLQRVFCVTLAVITAVLLAYFIFQRDDIQKSYLYPYPYKEIVLKYSDKYRIDSALVAAVIKTESKFKINAESNRGAKGLMQLMPETAMWINSQISEEKENFSLEKIQEPEINIKYGTWYLSILLVEFEGNEILALAAYNAGIGNVYSWMDEYGWDYDFSEVDSIPFGETREYVKSVLNNKIKYKALYS